MNGHSLVPGIGYCAAMRTHTIGRILCAAAVPMTLLILGGSTAGASSHPVSLVPHAVATTDGRHPVTHNTVPPMSTGWIQTVDAYGDSVYDPGSVEDLGSTASSPGEFSIRVHSSGSLVNVGISNQTGQPLVPGVVYQTSAQLTLGITGNFSSCSAGNYSVGVLQGSGSFEFDQLTTSGPSVNSYGIRFTCASSDGFSLVWGALGYNITPSTPHQGYYSYESNGLLSPYGNDAFLTYLGDLSATPLNKPIVGMAQTADGGGYWMVASDGGIFSFGDTGFYGSTGNIVLNRPIVGMAATSDGKGYWLVASDGGIFAFGDAAFRGSMGGATLNKPIVGMAPNPTGGYWLVASDGGIFVFGNAPFLGSTGNINLNKPVVGMTPTPNGQGYWFVASDGGIFAYGNAGFHGSTGNISLNQPIVGMAANSAGTGYWLIANDGGIFAFNVPYYGSLPGDGVSVTDVVGISV